MNRKDHEAGCAAANNGTLIFADERGSRNRIALGFRVHPRESASHKKVFAENEEVAGLMCKGERT